MHLDVIVVSVKSYFSLVQAKPFGVQILVVLLWYWALKIFWDLLFGDSEGFESLFPFKSEVGILKKFFGGLNGAGRHRFFGWTRSMLPGKEVNTYMLNPGEQASDIDVDDLHRQWKGKLHGLSDEQFSRLQKANPDEELSGPRVPSIGYYKLEDILQNWLPNIDVRKFADIGAGRGSWSLYCLNHWPKSTGVAISYWGNKHERFEAKLEPDQQVRLEKKTGDYRTMKCEGGFDLIMCDAGESLGRKAGLYPIFDDAWNDKERINNEKLLWGSDDFLLHEGLLSWIKMNQTADFVIKILVPGSSKTVRCLKEIQELTGKGCLIRLDRSRYTNVEAYFVSKPVTGVPLEIQVNGLYNLAHEQLRRGLSLKTPKRRVGHELDVTSREWVPLVHKGLEELPQLPPVDIKDSFLKIPEFSFVNRMLPMNFLREIGQTTIGGFGTYAPDLKNPFVAATLCDVEGLIPGYTSWRTTDTRAQETFRVVTSKIDKAPRENHRHYELKLEVAKAILDFCRERGLKMPPLTPEELGKQINRNGALGMVEERELSGEYSRLGDYFDRGPWKSRMRAFQKDLKEGHTNQGVMFSMGKLEKKEIGENRGSRLIWYFGGTVRLSEATNMGSLAQVLKKLPFSVSGMAVYDYGELMKQMLFSQDRVYIADDIRGWDTTMTVGDLRIEHFMLQELATDEEQKKVITGMYRLYANKHVMIARPGMSENIPVKSIFQLRGQRGSGEVPTYAMNTISNFIHVWSKHCDSESMPIGEIRKYTLSQLYKLEADRKSGSRTCRFSTLISGDDYVGAGSEGTMDKIAQNHDFDRECGKEVKGTAGRPSELISNPKDVSFCSHQFVEVTFESDQNETFKRMMPVRDVGEILAKATYMLKRASSSELVEAWARASAFNMLTMYPHIMDVRLVAATIASGTRTTVDLSQEMKAGRFKEEPWLGYKTVMRCINECLFGASTKFPRRERIANICDIKPVSKEGMWMMDITGKKKAKARKLWKESLPERVNGMRRALMDRYGQNSSFENVLHMAAPDWYPENMSLKISDYTKRFISTYLWNGQKDRSDSGIGEVGGDYQEEVSV